MKTKKIYKILLDYMYHDSFSYNPKWKYSSLPYVVKENYNKIYSFLEFMAKKNYITLLDDEEYAFVVHPQKLPDREQLMRDFMCFGSDTEN